jgi:hypothetical protein
LGDSQQEPPTTLAEAAERWGGVLTDIVPQVAKADVKYRTQLRLLRMHLRVQAYRWNNAQLPARLDQTAPASETRDTFGGGEFQYLPDPFGHYQLYSVGIPGIGRIDLKWRRDPNAPTTDPGDIPPWAGPL